MKFRMICCRQSRAADAKTRLLGLWYPETDSATLMSDKSPRRTPVDQFRSPKDWSARYGASAPNIKHASLEVFSLPQLETCLSLAGNEGRGPYRRPPNNYPLSQLQFSFPCLHYSQRTRGKRSHNSILIPKRWILGCRRASFSFQGPAILVSGPKVAGCRSTL